VTRAPAGDPQARFDAAAAPAQTSHIVQAINDLEAALPVDQLVLAGLRIWPLVRIKLYFGAVAAARTALGSPSTPAPARRPGLTLVADALRRRRARSKGHAAADVPRPADALFLSDGISFAAIAGRRYDKFCDPLIELLHAEGLSSFLMTPGNAGAASGQSPSFSIQRRLDRLVRAARLRFFLAGAAAAPLPGYQELARQTAQLGIGAVLPSLRQIRWLATQVRACADYFHSVLRTVRPRAGFVVSYYGDVGMAFALACREYGIPCIDVQHGVAGELCPPYGRWQRVPADGYGLLPSIFWCWSAADAAAIERWSAPARRWHTAVVGGNLWLAAWLRDDSELVREHDRLVAAAFPALERGGGRILLTLQPGFADERHLAPVLEAMRSAPPSWLWLVRLHPCMLDERSRVAHLLNSRGITRFELERATDLPLYAILRHADVHVTHSSATVAEAEAFGVPSVVTSSYGAEFFQDQIGNGRACAALTPAAILAAIGALLQGTDQRRSSRERVAVDGRAALCSILGAAPVT
jgi:hypothetical protein